MYLTISEWKNILSPSDSELFDDLGFSDCVSLSSDCVFDHVVSWRGGLASGYEVRFLISLIYDVEL